MAVPRFSYELSPRRKDRYVVSILLHIGAVLFLLFVVPLLPAPKIAPAQNKTTLLYEPAPEVKPPAPVLKPPPPEIVAPPPKVLAALDPPKLIAPPEPKVEPPKIELQPKLDLVKEPTPVKPKLEQKVVTGAFAAPELAKPVETKKAEVVNAAFSGSSQPATLNKPARDVQTGGFGDPNGIRGVSDKKGPATMAAVGSFDMPAGPGNGNGTGGARGAQGTVASTGFGDIAAGGTGNRNRAGTVVQAGFTQVSAPAAGPKNPTVEKANVKPVEILFKPRPAYTEEARQLHVQGEVLVEVMFGASGQLQVQRVVRGLGHGLDESAMRAAQQIRFRPAQRDGSPYDSAALVHIVFELAE